MQGVIWTPVVGERFRAWLSESAGIALVTAQNRDEAIAAARQAKVLITDGTTYDAVMAQALHLYRGRLGWVQLVSMGYDGLAQHGVPQDIVVTNVGDLYAPAVAEHAIALLLALSRRLIDCTAAAAERDRAQMRKPRLLQDCTIALIGCGNIGRHIARRLQPFGATLVAVARTGRSDPTFGTTKPLQELHTVLAGADAAILALPLTAQTRGLLSEHAFKVCKPGLWLVNVARGEIVDTLALAAALEDGRVGAAALDVTDPEPLPPDSPLWSSPNILITPHVGGVGMARAAERVAQLVADNVGRFRAGQPLNHVIKP